jgi:hypothetical protein
MRLDFHLLDYIKLEKWDDLVRLALSCCVGEDNERMSFDCKYSERAFMLKACKEALLVWMRNTANGK